MKLLDGRELAGFIKERQARQVRMLRQAHSIVPSLAIVQTIDDPVIATYVGLKQRYGADILVDVQLHQAAQADAPGLIERLNADLSVLGIIIQLPLAEPAETDRLLAMVESTKDVDGLVPDSPFEAATPMAIAWLLAGYNISLEHRTITIVGQGRLVGAPLAERWKRSGYDVTVIDGPVDDLAARLRAASVIVTATGVPGLITSDMIAPDSVVVDAGTASEDGKLAGDLAADVRERHDLTITPAVGGVGPLTVAALFDNVIRAGLAKASNKLKT